MVIVRKRLHAYGVVINKYDVDMNPMLAETVLKKFIDAQA